MSAEPLVLVVEDDTLVRHYVMTQIESLGYTTLEAANASDALRFIDEVPAIDANGTTWVEPKVVIEVRTLELTGQHRLRQPAFLGVRSDLNPADLEEVDDA